MNATEAYINGFVKRASEYGLSHSEALNVYKQAFLGNPAYEKAPNLSEDEYKNMSYHDMQDYIDPTKGEGVMAHLKRHPGAYTGGALAELLGLGASSGLGGDASTQLATAALMGTGGALAGSIPDVLLNAMRRHGVREDAEKYLNKLNRHAHMMKNLNSESQSFYHNTPE
jgi:hypothetical protein